MGKQKAAIYETMYILRPDIGEERTEQSIDKYRTLLQDLGVEKVEIQHRGKRRLAYEIDKHRDGIYIQMNYSGPGSCIATMERSMKMSEEVIRYLTIVQTATEPEPEPEEASEE
ncbi:MAG: 30S ribosomal protein S6 [Cyanobacteriota bacterium]|nr:30S ribosomal protein S6 [Cyanobacteriota bacterium]